jgi:hypothetical protein
MSVQAQPSGCGCHCSAAHYLDNVIYIIAWRWSWKRVSRFLPRLSGFGGPLPEALWVTSSHAGAIALGPRQHLRGSIVARVCVAAFAIVVVRGWAALQCDGCRRVQGVTPHANAWRRGRAAAANRLPKCFGNGDRPSAPWSAGGAIARDGG